MSQHDFNIANQGFPATRADINNAFAAIASTSSGATAPSTTFANQFWYDTANNLLMFRNEADSAWITLAYLDQASNEWEIRSAVIQAVDSAGVIIKTDDGTSRITVADSGNVTIANDLAVTGSVKPTTYEETYVANSTGATTTLDLSTGTNFSVILSENTTFVFSNPPSSGTAYAFTLVITQPSTAVTIAWPSSVDWAAATAPDAPGDSEVNAYGFMTRDGGTTYYGFLGGAALG